MTAVDDGVSYREVLQGLLARAKNDERRAELEAELYGPQLPPALAYLWMAFIRLRRRKGSNGFAVSPIEWPDFDAFIRLSGVRLAPWEIAAIEDIDDAFIAEQSKPAGGTS
ncbi:MAG: hypothetical protein V4477_16795 [Pseudomonadota bacterium]